jgi:RNA polymerase sigma factor (sigma-70 family)
MAAGRLSGVLDHLRQITQPDKDSGDGALLEQFVARRDEAAFAELLRRHGPMVLGVCRRLLRHEQDAEDAFQAAFLILARRATSVVPRTAVGPWLYGVACRTALEARGLRARRRAREQPLAGAPEPAVSPCEPETDLLALIDEELARLPERFRAALVLCDREGVPRAEAARSLGIPAGTLSSRLATARKRLAVRLARRGVSLSGTALAAGLPTQAASVSVPVALAARTVELVRVTNRGAVSVDPVTPRVAELTKGVLRAMYLKRLGAGLVLAFVVVLACGGLAWVHARGSSEAGQDRGARSKGEGARDRPPTARAGKRGDPTKQQPGKTDPPGVPLEATVKINKATYTLDLGGKTPAEFRKWVEATRLIAEAPEKLVEPPPPPAVDLILTVRNTSDKDVEVRISGDGVKVSLELKGPGALTKKLDRIYPLDLRLGEHRTLGPGKSHSFPITSLAYGFRSLSEGFPGASHLAYWTAPGEYTLTVSLQTEILPAPKGARQGYQKFGVVTLTAAPVKLRVKK